MSNWRQKERDHTPKRAAREHQGLGHWHVEKRSRIIICRNSTKQHIVRRYPKGQAKCPVTIVGKDPVVTSPKRQTGCDLNSLVSRTTDLEITLTLVLELDFFVVEATRQQHCAIDAAPLLA